MRQLERKITTKIYALPFKVDVIGEIAVTNGAKNAAIAGVSAFFDNCNYCEAPAVAIVVTIKKIINE